MEMLSSYHELCVSRSTQILALHSAKKQVLSAYIFPWHIKSWRVFLYIAFLFVILCNAFLHFTNTHTHRYAYGRGIGLDHASCHFGTSRIARTKRNAFETNEITDRCCFVGRTRPIRATNTKETCLSNEDHTRDVMD